MRTLLILILLLSGLTYAEKVYVTSDPYKTSTKVFTTPNAREANCLVYRVDSAYESKPGSWYMVSNSYEADRVIFYTNNAYEATVKVFLVPNQYEAKCSL